MSLGASQRELVCPMCGATVSAGTSVCDTCGERLSGPDPRPGERTDNDLLRRFRYEINWLTGLWIFSGAVLAGGGLVWLKDLILDLRNHMNDRLFFLYMGLGGLAIVAGIVMVFLGMQVFRRKIGSIKAGLVIAYSVLLASLVAANACGLVLVAVILLQSHDALRTARELQERGIPLDAEM